MPSFLRTSIREPQHFAHVHGFVMHAVAVGDPRVPPIGRGQVHRADNDVRLYDPSVQPHHLRVAVVGDSFRVAAVDGASGSPAL